MSIVHRRFNFFFIETEQIKYSIMKQWKIFLFSSDIRDNGGRKVGFKFF